MLAWVKNQRVRGVDVVLPTQQQHASVPMWQDAMQAHTTLQESLQLQTGHDVVLGQNLCLGLNYHIAETREKAVKEATPFFEEHLKMF
ncbi:MAG: hypothetical protein ACO2Z8_00930, partial [Burkholderiaceae bacterium]